MSNDPFDDSHRIDSDIIEQTVSVEAEVPVPILEDVTVEPAEAASATTSAGPAWPSSAVSSSAIHLPIRELVIEWNEADVSATCNLSLYHSNPQVFLLRLLFPGRVFTLTWVHRPEPTSWDPRRVTTTALLFEQMSTSPDSVKIAEGQCITKEDANLSLILKVIEPHRETLGKLTTQMSLAKTMFDMSSPRLLLLADGLNAMGAIFPAEWAARKAHLEAAEPKIGYKDTFEVRLENFLLQGGEHMRRSWLGEVRVAVGMSVGQRRGWARVYSEAETFLDEVGYGKWGLGWERILG